MLFHFENVRVLCRGLFSPSLTVPMDHLSVKLFLHSTFQRSLVNQKVRAKTFLSAFLWVEFDFGRWCSFFVCPAMDKAKLMGNITPSHFHLHNGFPNKTSVYSSKYNSCNKLAASQKSCCVSRKRQS